MSFKAGFTGCLGVGCAIVFVVIAADVLFVLLFTGAGMTPRSTDDTNTGATAVPSDAANDERRGDGLPVTFRRNQETGKEERIEGEFETEPSDAENPADLTLARPVEPSLRKWTSADGTYLMEAAFVKGNPTHITLEKADGTRVQVRRDELSHDDLEYIRKGKYKQGQ